MTVTAALVCHPGPTVGYRLDDGTSTLVYLSDHEPALGARRFPDLPRWTSGFDLADGADVLIHDAQYTDDEYEHHFGWGHSSIGQAVAFALHAGVASWSASIMTRGTTTTRSTPSTAGTTITRCA